MFALTMLALVAVSAGSVVMLGGVFLRGSTVRQQPAAIREQPAAAVPAGPIYVLRLTPGGDEQIVAFEQGPTGSPSVTPVFPSDQTAGAGTPIAMTVSHDRQRMYVLSDPSTSDTPAGRDYRLSAIDTSTKQVLDAESIDDIFGQIGGATFPPLAVAPDGGSVYVLQVSSGSAHEQQYSIGTYDVSSGSMLPQSVALGHGCGPAAIIPLLVSRSIAVACPGTSELAFFDISPSGSAATSSSLALTASDSRTDSYGNPLRLGSLSWAAATSDGSTIYAITKSGLLFIIDVGLRRVSQFVQLSIPADSYVPHAHLAVPTGRGLLFLGIQLTSAIEQGWAGHADRLVVVREGDWAIIATVPMADPFGSLTVDATGNVYATVPEAGGLLFVDPPYVEAEFLPMGEDPTLIA